MKHACIVIPLYKIPLSAFEQVSLDQCIKVLGKYDVYFVLPEHLEQQILPHHYIKTRRVKYKIFNDEFFKDLPGYNRLMKFPGFYKAFLDYEFMLIHQLDAFVFRDELDYWCSLDYDDIGAPLFEGLELAGPDSRMIGQGNGGFCLRKINSCYKVVTRFKKLWFKHPFYNAAKPFYLNLYRDVKYQLIYNYSWYPFQPVINEDVFWARLVPEVFKEFKVPNAAQAVPFSFEVNPDVLYQMNGHRLPFGCHAWWKYNLPFWKDHINACGYEL